MPPPSPGSSRRPRHPLDLARLGSGERTRWFLGAPTVLVVAVLTLATTLLLTRGEPDPAPPPSAAPPPPSPTVDAAGIASAEDDDPVGIITDDPTCAEWGPINDALATEQRNGWHQRDARMPAGEWTEDQRRQYRAVAAAMRTAADETVVLAKQTPHRVMRELYEQSIAYWRAYADSVDRYRPAADHLARTATSTSDAVVSICAAMDYGSAGARSPLVLPSPPQVPEVPLADPSRPARFITGPSPFCSEWTAMVTQYNDQVREWRERLDIGVPASYWPPDQRAMGDKVAAMMQQNADRAELLGLLSGNLVAADIAALSAHYRRAYALAIPTYSLPDIHLDAAASRLQTLTDQACQAVSN